MVVSSLLIPDAAEGYGWGGEVDVVVLNKFWNTHLPGFMKAYEHWVSKHFLISLNFPCLSLLTVLFCLCRIFFFGCFVVRDLRRSGFRHNLATSSSFKTPSLPRGCFSFPTQNSLSHINDSYRISWNNSRHSINRLPRIIDPLWPKYLKYSPPSNNRPSPAPLAIFSSFYLLLEVQRDSTKLISDDPNSEN